MTDEPLTAEDLVPFLRAHQCFRRDFARLRTALAGDGPFDADRQAALCEHWRGLSAVLDHHHQNEDDVLFPAVLVACPEAADIVRGLDGEHVRLHDLLGRAAPAVAAVGVRRAMAADLMAELADLVVGHLDTEERELVPLFERSFSRAEWIGLEAATTRDLEYAGLLPFALPWVAEGLNDRVMEPALEALGQTVRSAYHQHWRISYQQRCDTLWG